MGNGADIATNIHIYKPARRSLVFNILSLVFMGIVFGIPLVLLTLMLVSIVRAESEFDTFMIFFLCLLSPIIILLIFNLIQMSVGVVSSFFAYIKISPEGIEQKNPIYKHIRCNWSDVDKLGKFFLFTDVIYLNSFEVLGLSLSLKSPLRLFRPKQGLIALSGFEGWPDGQLGEELRHYAPKLFENQQVHQDIQPERNDSKKDEAHEISSEVRLLAALSHVSIFFSYVGVLVPIGIYLTQKKKSTYIAFQSLQALTWQLIAFAFNLLSSACMMGAVFIPIFLAVPSQNGKLLESSGGLIFFAMIISIILMIFGNLVFIIYGVIGAIMTYQGKDFRYVVIGRMIQKNIETSNSEFGQV